MKLCFTILLLLAAFSAADAGQATARKLRSTQHGASRHGQGASQLACEQSGYCSLGKTKPYVGEIETSASHTIIHCVFCRAPRGRACRARRLVESPLHGHGHGRQAQGYNSSISEQAARNGTSWRRACRSWPSCLHGLACPVSCRGISSMRANCGSACTTKAWPAGQRTAHGICLLPHTYLSIVRACCMMACAQPNLPPRPAQPVLWGSATMHACINE